MATTVINFRGNRQQLANAIAAIPALLAGRIPDGAGLARQVHLRLGMTALSIIKDAYHVKALGGTDESGEKWEPLSPVTIARRRQGPADRRAMRDRLAGLSWQDRLALNRAESQRLALLMARGVPPGRAAALARAQAFESLRRGGAKIPTRKEILGNRQVEILRDTGRLLNSLSPAEPDADRIVRATGSGTAVGTNVRYGSYHHHGGPRLPRRRLWPVTSRWPASWMRQLYAQLIGGVSDALAHAGQ